MSPTVIVQPEYSHLKTFFAGCKSCLCFELTLCPVASPTAVYKSTQPGDSQLSGNARLTVRTKATNKANSSTASSILIVVVVVEQYFELACNTRFGHILTYSTFKSGPQVGKVWEPLH